MADEPDSMKHEILSIDLSAKERHVLLWGLINWGGPAHCTDELAIAIGFDSRTDFHKQVRSHLLPRLRAQEGLSRENWWRVLLATELCFASGLVGSGSDWSATTGISDSESIQLLRSLQRKVRHATWEISETLARRPLRAFPPSSAIFQPEPEPEACLAYAVLTRPDDWLGLPSPTALLVFLAGAKARASALAPSLSSWRIYGPLLNDEFSTAMLQSTAAPSSSCQWSEALEFSHYSMAEAMLVVRRTFVQWFDHHRIREEPVGHAPIGEPSTFWRDVAQRPQHHLGGTSGWHLSWYLEGMTKGGDWLGLPPFPQAERIAGTILRKSKEAFGHELAMFRGALPDGNAARLLALASIGSEDAAG